MTVDLRAITVRQPWAWAIAHAGKTTENRSHKTHYRGPLAIHAGKAWAPDGAVNPAVKAAFDPARAGQESWFITEDDAADGTFVFSAVIALAEIVDIHPAAGGCCAPWGMTHNTNPYAVNRDLFHYQLADIRPLTEPVPCPGQLGLWRPRPSLAALITTSVE
jgi:hypothetical protein